MTTKKKAKRNLKLMEKKAKKGELVKGSIDLVIEVLEKPNVNINYNS